MTDLLIRNVPGRTLAALKARAKRNGHSVAAEALSILEAGARFNGDDFADEIVRLRASGKVSFDVSALLDALREDRER